MFLRYFFLILFLTSTRYSLAFQEANQTPIQLLAHRLLDTKANYFVFELKADTGKDFYELKSEKGLMRISGNNYNSMAAGLNYYLRYYCKTYVSWYVNDPVRLPDRLPEIDSVLRNEARLQNRFFLNYCTFGYTMPWWQWKDWERMIDWMALNGINMPLAITGQEAIWYDVWKDYGMSDEQIRTYFTGPAHLPWHRMSNLDKWGGALPKSWLDHQKELQKKIVARERELNMTPVLPAFAGHVPEALATARPKAKINQLSSWGGFPDQYRSFFLDPLDPLFTEIQQKFLTRQTELYGTDHIYGADPFNEVHPPSWAPDYLASVANTIYSSMHSSDPKATWLQMSWIFYFEREHWTNERIQAMVTAVPSGKMILLDYFCENQEVWKMTDSYFGQPFIWNYLGNFGGNTMLAGNLDEVNQKMENAFINAGRGMVGLGSTLEAFDVNSVMYSYVFEKNWTKEKTSNTKDWIKGWADSRYGAANDSFEKAWELLHKEVYNRHATLGQGTLTNARPSLKGHGNWTTNPEINYSNEVLLEAWELMLRQPSSHPAYRYDIVNIGRQFLGNYFLELRDTFTRQYEQKDLNNLRRTGKKMDKLFKDLDKLLATESSFLGGKWIRDAGAMGVTEEEKEYYKRNARNLITTWGSKAQSLNDYANRSWAGLTKTYYKKRWNLFIDEVIQSVRNGSAFDEKKFNDVVTSFEWNWIHGDVNTNATPKGNSVKLAKRLIKKYKKK